MSCYYGGNEAENYRQGYQDAQRKYEGVTIDGLKATMEVMEVALMKKDRRIEELEAQLSDAEWRATNPGCY